MRYNKHVQWFGTSRGSLTPRPPSVAQCALTMTFVKLALMIVGFGATLRWMRRHVPRMPISATVTPESVKAFEYAVAMAAAFFPGRAQCLERSLTLLYLARRSGIPVTYHQGVTPTPFAAHAWIEYQGQIINDVPEHVAMFRPFPQVCP